MDQIEIRKELQRIVSEPIKNSTNDSREEIMQRVRKQVENIVKINDIIYIPEPFGWTSDEFADINCHAYSLDFWKIEGFKEHARKYSERSNGKNKIDYSIINMLFKKDEALSEPTEGCLIVYYEDNKPTHSGIVRATNPIIIESKWGVLPVFKHPLLYIPTSYGTEFLYFDVIHKEKILSPFKNVNGSVR